MNTQPAITAALSLIETITVPADGISSWEFVQNVFVSGDLDLLMQPNLEVRTPPSGDELKIEVHDADAWKMDDQVREDCEGSNPLSHSIILLRSMEKYFLTAAQVRAILRDSREKLGESGTCSFFLVRIPGTCNCVTVIAEVGDNGILLHNAPAVVKRAELRKKKLKNRMFCPALQDRKEAS